MTEKKLTVHNAQITTVRVEVQKMAIDGKQVTQSVFRQLQEQPLIASDGTFNGNPWGTVNYHPDKCGDSPLEHWHVVWQDGGDLRRSRVDKTAAFDRRGWDENTYYCDEGDAFRTACVRDWLTTGETPYFGGHPFGSDLNQADEYNVRRTVELRQSRNYTAELPGGLIAIDVTAEAVAATQTALRFRQSEERLAAQRAKLAEAENWSGAACGYVTCEACPRCLERATARMGEFSEALARHEADYAEALKVFEADCDRRFKGATTEDLVREYHAVRQSERDRRERHRALLQAIAELPQLFIAV
jgi:hypothetical protein